MFIYAREVDKNTHTQAKLYCMCNEINSGSLCSISHRVAACFGCRRWVDIVFLARRPFRLSIDFICSRKTKAMLLFFFVGVSSSLYFGSPYFYRKTNKPLFWYSAGHAATTAGMAMPEMRPQRKKNANTHFLFALLYSIATASHTIIALRCDNIFLRSPRFFSQFKFHYLFWAFPNKFYFFICVTKFGVD